jgi:hypothetical protein
VGKKGGFGRRDSRARRWREDPPAAPRILRGPGGTRIGASARRMRARVDVIARVEVEVEARAGLLAGG